MTELEQRLGLRNAEGKLIPISDRDRHIVSHYEREIAKDRMSVNIATDRAKHDLAATMGTQAFPNVGEGAAPTEEQTYEEIPFAYRRASPLHSRRREQP